MKFEYYICKYKKHLYWIDLADTFKLTNDKNKKQYYE